MRVRWAIGLVAVGSSLAHSAAHGGTVPDFQGLGYLLAGGSLSRGYSVSGNGHVVVGVSDSLPSREAFRWTATGGLEGLGPGGSLNSSAYGVSYDGSVIAGEAWVSGGQAMAALWTETGGFQDLGHLGRYPSEAKAVSADGSVVVGYSHTGSEYAAFRWTESEGMVSLGGFSGRNWDNYGAWGISNDGTVIVGRGVGGQQMEAFRWTSDGGLQGLGDLPGGAFASFAYAVSGDGNAVVGHGTSENGQEAVRWTSDTGIAGLGDLEGGDFQSCAYGISADGTVIVGQGSSANGDEAFIWDEGNSMRRLADVLTAEYGLCLCGWTLVQARDISDDGCVIVGWGVNPDGKEEAWLVVIPEPATLSLLALGGLLLVRGRWNRIRDRRRR